MSSMNNVDFRRLKTYFKVKVKVKLSASVQTISVISSTQYLGFDFEDEKGTFYSI